jgi:30S ribosomal protein 3
MEKFILKFLWLEKSIAVSLDQKIAERSSPLTEYFFWPQEDAWEEMKMFLEQNNWISQLESINILNQVTEVINYWQEKDSLKKKDIYAVRERFPNAKFTGYD